MPASSRPAARPAASAGDASGGYQCGWCGHAGARIDEQRITYRDPVTGQPVTRWVCWLCGQDVEPLQR